jgi:hypothetical protein
LIGKFFLCLGVHDYLNDTALQNLMSTASTVSDIVDKALDAESSDNISAMIVKIDQIVCSDLWQPFFLQMTDDVIIISP